MPSPVNPSQFCEAVPTNSSDLCTKLSKFFGIAQLLCDFFSYFLNSDGTISDAVKNELSTSTTPTGMVVASVTLNMGSGWLQCDGSAVSRTTYAALFAEVGTRYGAGNGTTTFNLPDLRSRSIIGAGSGDGLTARDINNPEVGEETHVQTESELAPHLHGIKVRHFTIGFASEPGVRDLPSPTGVDTFDTNTTGGGVGFNVVHPCFVLHWFVKT